MIQSLALAVKEQLQLRRQNKEEAEKRDAPEGDEEECLTCSA